MTKKISDSQVVRHFINIANEYCTFIENRSQYTDIEILQYSYRLLHKLSLSAMDLPEIKNFPYYENSSPDLSWQEIYQSLQSKLKHSKDSYLHIEPYGKTVEPVSSSLSNDLSEIYENIAPGLKDWEKADADLRRGIIWNWKFLYDNHWGEHTVWAISTLYSLLFSEITDSTGDYIGLRKSID